MQTALADFIKDTPQGRLSEQILRNCVHCGFCTATCPTYQLLGDELDGPRGRIYQIKQVLEGNPATTAMRNHLDRCLSCRSCETTCPSGVEYHKLLDIGREVVEQQAPRPQRERMLRRAMIELLAYPQRFTPLLRVGQWLRPLLPGALRQKVPSRAADNGIIPNPLLKRRMLILQGCVQSGISPHINQAATHVFMQLGIHLQPISEAGCCGALPQHLSDNQRALTMARNNIDAWYPHLLIGAECLLVSASGCGTHVQDYGHLLADDPAYAEKAAYVAQHTRDLVEALREEDIDSLPLQPCREKIAVHTPCTLQHGLGLGGEVEKLLTRLGYQLVQVDEGHLCCGSAGTYSITQPKLSQQLRERKLTALASRQPDRIVSANIGCILHLQDADAPPVEHWINRIESDLKK